MPFSETILVTNLKTSVRKPVCPDAVLLAIKICALVALASIRVKPEARRFFELRFRLCMFIAFLSPAALVVYLTKLESLNIGNMILIAIKPTMKPISTIISGSIMAVTVRMTFFNSF